MLPMECRKIRPMEHGRRYPSVEREQEKRSFGIACCRYNSAAGTPRYEVLMMRKRYTYAFFSFVFGKYKKNDDVTILALLNDMTNQEKLDILSRRFDYLWWRIWLTLPETATAGASRRAEAEMLPPMGSVAGANARPSSAAGGDIAAVSCGTWLDAYKKKTLINFIKTVPPLRKQELYIRKKARFESMFLRDNGAHLERLIKQSHRSAELLWEIPKGHIYKNEVPYQGAMREFREETGVKSSDYRILFDVTPYTYSYESDQATYTDCYYVAVTTRDVRPRTSFVAPTQMLEVDTVRWMGIEEMRGLTLNRQTLPTVRAIFKLVRKRRECIKEEQPPVVYELSAQQSCR